MTQGFHAGHLAIDFVSTLEHRPVLRCPSRGRVTHAGPDTRPELAQHPEWDRGLYVAVNHADGARSRWCHLSALRTQVGALLEQGQPFGVLGASGYVVPPGPAGAHCHGGVVDEYGAPVDWLAWLP